MNVSANQDLLATESTAVVSHYPLLAFKSILQKAMCGNLQDCHDLQLATTENWNLQAPVTSYALKTSIFVFLFQIFLQ